MSFMSRLTETDSTHIKISHVSTLSTTLEASAYYWLLNFGGRTARNFTDFLAI
jgi:hypothetical protein